MKSLPSPKPRDQARLSPWCCRSRNCTECDRNTSSIACNEHVQTVMGQQKMQNLPALAQCRTNVMGQRWADEQTLGWPIQYLQPWANRAASDGPMEGQCIRAIWVDREVQRSKRFYWYKMQCDLVENATSNHVEFWKNIGKIGIGQSRKKYIPMEVEGESGDVDRNILNVLDRWKQDFSSLLNAANINSATFGNETNNEDSDPFLDSHINIMEVRKVVFDAKKGKACGLDQIPYEVLCNDTSISFLHILFNICYNTATVPTIWNCGIINPIPKSSTSDPRNPLSYRGITLACCMYKLYTAVLRNRLGMWCENNGKLVDEQNGFREKRSTIDHLQSLTSIIDSRKKKEIIHVLCIH